MGLRIADRIRQDYGHLDESVDVLGRSNENENYVEASGYDEDLGGGFLPEGYEEDEAEKEEPRQTSSFFNAPENHDEDDEGEDPFQVEYDKDSLEPESAEVRDGSSEIGRDEAPARALRKAAPKAKSKSQRSTRRRTRRKIESSDEDEEDEEFQLSDNDE